MEEYRAQSLPEAFFEKPYWIVDILPKQVPAGSPGQYFTVEQFFRRKKQMRKIRRGYLSLLLKLNCYFDLRVSRDDGTVWEENPQPEILALLLKGKAGMDPAETVYVHFTGENSLAVLNRDDTYMTVYDPTDQLLKLLRDIASAEGLFVWQPVSD